MILLDEQVNVISESCKMHRVLKDSHLEANAKIRELEAKIKEHEQDGYRVSFELGKALRDKIAAAIDEMIAREDRADRLAVIADALAVEVTESYTTRTARLEKEIVNIERDRARCIELFDMYYTMNLIGTKKEFSDAHNCARLYLESKRVRQNL